MRKNMRGRSGFGLAEALAMVIVVGTLAVPLGGLMGQMVGKTADVEEQAIARQMALGVQANIIAYGAYNPNIDYSVPDQVSTRGATLTAILTWDPNVSGMGFIGAPNTLSVVANPQRMAAYRIDVERLANPALEIEAASMTFLTGVVFTEVRETDIDLLYAAVPSQKRIFAIHPVDHETWDYFDTDPYIPVDLAVHPNGGWLAIKCPQHILLMDIRPDSGTLGSYSVIYSTTTSSGFCASPVTNDTTGDMSTRLDRGIAFRPDGKYLYWSTNDPPQISVLRAPPTFPPPLGSTSPPWLSLTTGSPEWPQTFSGTANSLALSMLQNGFLHWGCRDWSTAEVYRLNTHNHKPDSLDVPLTVTDRVEQRAIAQSWDSNETIYQFGNYNLGAYLSHAPTHFWNAPLMNHMMTYGFQANGLLVTRDNRFILGCSSRSNGGDTVKRLYAINRREYNTTWDVTSSPNVATTIPQTQAPTSLVHSPYGKEVVADTVGNHILFIDVASFVAKAGCLTSWTPDSASGPANISAVAGRVPEIAWIAGADGMVRSLDIYGGQATSMGGQLFGNDIGIGSVPLSIALTAGGDRAVVCTQGSGHRPILIDLLAYPATWSAMTGLTPYPTGATAIVAAFTYGGSLIVGFHKTESTAKGPQMTVANGFLVYPADATGMLNNVATCGYALPSNFVIKQIVPFHRREGALVLFQDLTSTPRNSFLIWVEPSAQGGTTGPGAGGDEGAPNWRILSAWEGKYDGFPEGAPCRMALAPDDSMLAMLDLPTAGGNTRNVIRLYDLTNQRFPMQQGLGVIRYASNIGNFDSLPTDNPILIKNQVVSRYNLKYHPTYPANFLITSGDSYYFCTIRHFGYWYVPPDIQRISALTREGIRLWLDGTQPSLSGNTSGANLWHDTSAWWYFHWNYTMPSPPIVHFQAEFFDSDHTYSTMGWAWASSSLSTPDGYTNSGTLITGLKTGASPWAMIQTPDFRVFRFRPQLIQQIFMDGSSWPGDPATITDDLNLPSLLGGNEEWYEICFHRDTSRPTLFLISPDGSLSNTVKLSGLGLFGSPNWGTRDPLPDANQGWEMAVSPDGRRLILVGADSAPRHLVHLIDIAYPFPWAAPNLGTAATVTIELTGQPVAMGVRPFTSFTSKPDTIEAFPNVSGIFSARCGNQTAALASGGIYIVGGSNGHAGAAQASTYRFNPVTRSAETRANLPAARAHSSVVSFDGKILALGGKNGTDFADVYSYNPALNAWTSLIPLQANDNSDYTNSQAATTLTPYGIVMIGGVAPTTVTSAVKVYYPQVYMNPNWGETLAMSSLPDGAKANGAAVCHFSRKDKKWYLYLIGGGTGPGLHDNSLIRRFNFDTNTWDQTWNIGNDALTERTQAAACSWGDEIFIYGGCRSSKGTPTGIAFNPDTQKYRPLTNLPDSYSIDISAVPCGPYVYLINGCNAANDNTGATTIIRAYTP